VKNEERENLRRFYETSSEYKDLLIKAHDRAYLNDYVNTVLKYARKGSYILDLGCGSGLSSYMLSEHGHRVYGTDISSFFLAEADGLQSKNLGYQVCDVLDLPFRNESFDMVCSNELIEHVTDTGRALLEMIRVLKKGGRTLIMGPNLCSPFWAVMDIANMLLGRGGRQLWAETKLQALKLGFKNLALSLRKKFSKKIEFIYRKPDLDGKFVGGDSDSAYYASPIDIERFLKANSMRIIRLYEYSTFSGRIVSNLFPRLGPYVSIVAEKI